MLTIIAMFLLAILAVPVYGMWMLMTSESSGGKILGAILLAVGCFIYFGMGGR